jgi:hypothetical protein
MVFETTIKYIEGDDFETIEINKSYTQEQAIEWKTRTISGWYDAIVCTDSDDTLPEPLNDIMNNLNPDSEEQSNYKVDIIKFVIEMQNKYEQTNYKVDIIKFVIEMQNKYEQKNTSLTIHECKIEK